jgi:hypothetical protein
MRGTEERRRVRVDIEAHTKFIEEESSIEKRRFRTKRYTLKQRRGDHSNAESSKGSER